jgi:RNA polymerase sigma factor (sigma-70 family)
MGAREKPEVRPRPERDALALQFLPLVSHVVGRLWHRLAAVRRLGFDEALSVGQLALLNAAAKYDPANPARAGFKTYAYHSISNQVVRVARYGNRIVRVPDYLVTPHRLNFEPAADRRAAAAVALAPTLSLDRLHAHPQATRPDPDAADSAAAVLAALPDRDRRVLELYYGDGWTLAEVGRELGVTRVRVMQLRDRALARLRQKARAGKERDA